MEKALLTVRLARVKKVILKQCIKAQYTECNSRVELTNTFLKPDMVLVNIKKMLHYQTCYIFINESYFLVSPNP